MMEMEPDDVVEPMMLAHDGDSAMLETVGDALMILVDDVVLADGFEPLHFMVEPMV